MNVRECFPRAAARVPPDILFFPGEMREDEVSAGYDQRERPFEDHRRLTARAEEGFPHAGVGRYFFPRPKGGTMGAVALAAGTLAFGTFVASIFYLTYFLYPVDYRGAPSGEEFAALLTDLGLIFIGGRRG